jgi:hypothetical protein
MKITTQKIVSAYLINDDNANASAPTNAPPLTSDSGRTAITWFVRSHVAGIKRDSRVSKRVWTGAILITMDRRRTDPDQGRTPYCVMIGGAIMPERKVEAGGTRRSPGERGGGRVFSWRKRMRPMG